MNENFNAWVDTLRTTDLPQARNRLRNLVLNIIDKNDRYAYCCLGVACTMTDAGEEYLSGWTMLPAPVAEWLGLDEYWQGSTSWREFAASDNDGVDIWLDIPHETQQEASFGIPNSCAALNDRGFTFSQIADMITYFGVKEIC